MAASRSDAHTDRVELLYRDELLLCVNKPSGLLTHRGWANDRDTALTRARSIAGCYVYPVHRLDRATSGVLLFALTQAAASALGQQRDHDGFDKCYLGLVRGVIAPQMEIDYPLTALDGDKAAERKPARTSVTRLGTFERYSLVQAVPHTGRTHQIRRHLKHVSHPIIGDTRYGHGEHNRVFRERFGLHRLSLHAASLSFTHPGHGARMSFHAPLPADLVGPLQAMSLLSAELAAARLGASQALID
jgi:tRNA pseudouridine65 synthase